MTQQRQEQSDEGFHVEFSWIGIWVFLRAMFGVRNAGGATFTEKLANSATDILDTLDPKQREEALRFVAPMVGVANLSEETGKAWHEAQGAPAAPTEEKARLGQLAAPAVPAEQAPATRER